MKGRESATAFAPGSVANVAVGFDLLGHSVSPVGDRITARRIPEKLVRIDAITGCEAGLPMDIESNTAGRAACALIQHVGIDGGIALEIYKGIPLESGLGGSAASAVAAVVAINSMLPRPLDTRDLLPFALDGEEVASGARHADNVAASLFGGLVMVVDGAHPQVARIPVPLSLRCVLVHPHTKVSTREARSMLTKTVSFQDCLTQQANLAGFLVGCYTGNASMIRATLADVIVEPQRKKLIPGFDSVKERALAEGALGCSIAGAGPTVFAWCEEPAAGAICASMVAAFARHGVETDSWICGIGTAAAHLLDHE